MTRRTTMTKRTLLLGVRADLLDAVREWLQMPDVELLGGTGVEDVRSALAHADIDHVIVRGNIDLETRLEIVREVLLSSDLATIHLKDDVSGRDGFLPFVRSVLLGLEDYEPHESPTAIRRAPVPDPGTDGT
jgi:hypothetical protein